MGLKGAMSKDPAPCPAMPPACCARAPVRAATSTAAFTGPVLADAARRTPERWCGRCTALHGVAWRGTAAHGTCSLAICAKYY